MTIKSTSTLPLPSDSSPPGGTRRRWASVVGIAVVALGVLAVAYTALTPQTTPPAAGSTRSAPTAFTATTFSGQQKVAVPGGKPSVVFFFSSTCGACGPFAQALAQVQAAVPGANYVAVDIDPSETVADVREFLTTNRATGLAYTLDRNAALTRAYKITQLSTAVVTDLSGDIVYRAVDPTSQQIRSALTTASTP